MPDWQVPNMPPVPGLADVLRTMQKQAEVMADLPATISELTAAARSLAETVEMTNQAVAQATLVISRLQHVIEQLEEPVVALRPGITRVGDALNAPVIDRVPGILESIEGVVLPLTRSVERVRSTAARAAAKRDGVIESARAARVRRRKDG